MNDLVLEGAVINYDDLVTCPLDCILYHHMLRRLFCVCMVQ